MITNAKNNEIERFQRNRGRTMNEHELHLFNLGYAAGHEDKADEVQPEIMRLSQSLNPTRSTTEIKTTVFYGN